MLDNLDERIEKLTTAVRHLRDGQLYWVEKVTEALSGPSETSLMQSDLLNSMSAYDFGDILKIHHIFSAEPFTKDKFEYALVQVLGWHGKQAALATKGNPGHDATVDGQRFSLKTQADKGIKATEIWISKFMEMGKGKWGKHESELGPLRDAFLEHLARYDRILTLRAISKAPNWHYELVEVHKAVLERAKLGVLQMKRDSKQHPKPGYCRVQDDEGHPLFELYFDGGTERKLQIKALQKSACTVHAEWKFTQSPQ